MVPTSLEARENLGNLSMHGITTKTVKLYYRRISSGYLTPIWVTTCKIVSSDSQDPELLTSNHLLLLQSEPQMPPGLFQKEDSLSRPRWRQVQYLADTFWKRWFREYLLLLQSRQKWIALLEISAENSPRNTWPLGRVIEVLTCKKGLVRRAEVKVRRAVVERSIDKLCLLLEAWAFPPNDFCVSYDCI